MSNTAHSKQLCPNFLIEWMYWIEKARRIFLQTLDECVQKGEETSGKKVEARKNRDAERTPNVRE